MTGLTYEAALRIASEAYFAYADAADSGDLEAFADLFAGDCRFDGGDPSPGRDRILRRAGRVLGLFSATSHHVSNVRVSQFSTDDIVCSAAVMAWHRKLNGETFIAFGRYQSCLRREADRWRFSEHTIRLAGSEGSDGRTYQTLAQADLSLFAPRPSDQERT